MLYHFFRECLNPKVRINKMVNKPNVNYQPSPSGLTSSYQPMMNDTYLPFHRPFTALPFSRNFIFQSCIPYHNWRKFQIYGVPITGKCICDSKNWIYKCLLMPLWQKFPRSFIITYWQKKINNHPQGSVILKISPSRKRQGERNYENCTMISSLILKLKILNFKLQYL